jgi:predicted peptidase
MNQSFATSSPTKISFMKTTLGLLIILTLSVCSTMKAKAQSPNPALTAKTLKWKVARAGETHYLAYVPKDYNRKDAKRWPLMLFLHGAGERGTDLQRVAIHGPPSLVKQGREFPFILIAPQCPEGERWQDEALLQLLDQVVHDYAVDTNRVYLTGLSMGGYGTWKLGVAHPERFAAIVPICGGGETIDVLLAARERAEALKSLPVWAFHGAKDPVVPLAESERMVNALKKLGSQEVKLTVYPEAQHNSWAETYNNPEVYEWLLKHSRK